MRVFNTVQNDFMDMTTIEEGLRWVLFTLLPARLLCFSNLEIDKALQSYEINFVLPNHKYWDQIPHCPPFSFQVDLIGLNRCK